ncbi:hypothetical protein KC345_g913 [Hortaea werneckii]|nr:hypothetical protein KC345_g913 [Hortaea werneckii]
MSGPQPNVWQTAARNRQSQSASRTPHNRSTNASPAQQTNPTQPPRQEGGRPQQVQNVWAQRSSSAGGASGSNAGSNGATPALQQESKGAETHASVNGFNASEVKAFLSRDVKTAPSTYKVTEGGGAGRSGGGGAWGSKPNAMANGQPFFVQLAKSVATIEGGG